MKSIFIKDVFDSPLQDLEWIGHCPRLETLHWHTTWTVKTAPFFQRIKLQQWSQLTNLALICGSHCQFYDHELASMLDACAHLRVLTFGASEFWYRSLKSLGRHLDTLEQLNLFACRNARNWVCQWILTRSPKLKSFYCEYIEAQELITDCPNAKAIMSLKASEEKETVKRYVHREERWSGFQRTRDELRGLQTTIAEFEAIRSVFTLNRGSVWTWRNSYAP